MTNYNDGNWHGWNGGECPVHLDSEVDVMIADGIREFGKAKVFFWHETDDPRCAIAAFRVIKEHKEPRELWVDSGDCAWDTYEEALRYCNGGEKPALFREVIE